MIRPVIAASLAVLLPTILQAQGRGAIAAAPHVMAAAPHVTAAVPSGIAHVGRPAVVSGRPVAAAPTARAHGGHTGVPRTTSRITTRNGNIVERGGSRRFDDDERRLRPGCSTVPGLGFDVPHLAATCGPEAVGGGRNAFQSGFFLPFFDGGYVMPEAPVVEEAPAAEAPASEETDAEIRARARRLRASREEPAPVAAQPDNTPVRESNEYVFVRRDGTVFFAVGYVWEKGTLRYVTSEGLRKSMASDLLDLKATQQFNEQRGVDFRLPS